MLLAKEKLNSNNKIEFTSGVVLNLLFLILFGQSLYYYFNDGNINGYEYLNIVSSLFNFSIAYLLLGDATYFKKHVGTLEWYKNKLQIKYNMEENAVTLVSLISIVVFSLIFFFYSGFNMLERLRLGYWNSNLLIIQFYLSIIVVNIYILIAYHYIGQATITEEQILAINDVVELTDKDKKEFEIEMASIVRSAGVVKRIQLSAFFIKKEKAYKINMLKRNCDYESLLKKHR